MNTGFTISEETKKKNKLGNRERGKILYRRLKELADSGQLNRANTRSDIALMIGAKYTWVNGMVQRGFLKEEIAGFDNGTPQYFFSLSNKEPDYTYKNVGRKKEVKEEKTKYAKLPEKEVVVTLQPSTIKVETKGVQFTIERIDVDDMIKLIKALIG